MIHIFYLHWPSTLQRFMVFNVYDTKYTVSLLHGAILEYILPIYGGEFYNKSHIRVPESYKFR